MEKSACNALWSLILDEEIGLHEYLSFATKHANTGRTSTFDMEKTLKAIDEISRDEAKHGLKLIELLPIYCSEPEFDTIGRDNIREIRDYFFKRAEKG